MTEIKFKQLQNKQWLVGEIKGKTLRDIAKSIGCSYSAVVYAIKIHEIDVQSLTGGKRVRRSLTEEKMLPKQNELIEAYKNGVSLVEIAKEYGITHRGIRKIFNSWGVDTSLNIQPEGRTKLNNYKNEIIEQYTSGKLSVAQIGIRYHASYKTVHSTLEKWGIKINGRVSKNEFLRDKKWLEEKYIIDKLSMTEIAKISGSTPGNVYSALCNAAIETRSLEEGKALIIENISGENAPNWKGGRVKTSGGYIYQHAPSHPFAANKGYVMEHRLAMEKKLGRYLTKEEIVHHKDGNKSNNDISNLELSSDRGTHTRDHFERSHITEVAELEVARLKKLLSNNGIES